MKPVFYFLLSILPLVAMSSTQHKNVLGTELEICSTNPLTGFYRDGFCKTGIEDRGTHVISAVITKEFLEFTKSRGNDLETPKPEHSFPGLKPGDCWCLCATRWKEAEEAGVAPFVKLESTHEKALEFIPLDKLKQYKWSLLNEMTY